MFLFHIDEFRGPDAMGAGCRTTTDPASREESSSVFQRLQTSRDNSEPCWNVDVKPAAAVVADRVSKQRS
jgi:hypothetical protein